MQQMMKSQLNIGSSIVICLASSSCSAWAFHPARLITHHPSCISKKIFPQRSKSRPNSQQQSLASSPNEDDSDVDANRWISLDEKYNPQWVDEVQSRKDGSLWSSFDSPSDEYVNGNEDESNQSALLSDAKDANIALDDGEMWLDVLASIAAEEINFINVEADRADKQRQMQEWGFEADTIANALDLAKDDKEEIDEENVIFEQFKEETAKTGFGMYLDDDEDLETVESHTRVEIDEETGEPVRSQMIYVDEVSCVGCYNCANIAQSTFFMESEMGWARVFQQWGDDDETIAIAIETCPVDCIHYVPYDKLVNLEIEQRDQVINFKARLVNQSNSGAGMGGSQYTGPQKISGDSRARCNNCPSKGCEECPMYGIGKNPYFEKREKEHLERRKKRMMKQQMEASKRCADL